MTPLISVNNLTKIYGEAPNKTIALDNVSLGIHKGEFVAIIGPSGSGKSTFMHILGALDKPTSGKYFLDGKQVSKLSEKELAKIRNKQIGFVFQSFNLLAKTSAIKNVSLPLVYSQVKAKTREDRALKMLSSVGLENKGQSKPNELSGGQQQRVAIARALINNPLIIFADEPTGNLDTKASAEIMEIFRKLNEEGHTIVMITHEMEVAKYASRIITIRDGAIVNDTKNKKKR